MNMLMFGRKLIDLDDPKPDQIDYAAVRPALSRIRRFGGNPNALTVRQHGIFVRLLFEWACKDTPFPVEEKDILPYIAHWCEHHDDHEAIIGDIPGPVKRYLSAADDGKTLARLEQSLDFALHRACPEEMDYLVPWRYPTKIRVIVDAVDHFDRWAETLEWLHVLHQPRQSWNVHIPSRFELDVPHLLRQTYERDLE